MSHPSLCPLSAKYASFSSRTSISSRPGRIAIHTVSEGAYLMVMINLRLQEGLYSHCMPPRDENAAQHSSSLILLVQLRTSPRQDALPICSRRPAHQRRRQRRRQRCRQRSDAVLICVALLFPSAGMSGASALSRGIVYLVFGQA